MTDKQIIINGCDVSGCECIIEDYQRANNFEGRYEHIKNVCELGERGAEYYNLFCKDNPNCYYKQLQREKQNSQEARDTAIKEFNRAEKLKMLLKRKEQECEKAKQNAQDTYDLWQELIESFNILQGKKIKLEQEYEKLKQTLTEIKPILELYANSKIGEEQLDGTYKIAVKNSSVLGDTYITFDPRPAKQALQKIKECKVEND